ncbi:hypothetical protein Tco_0048004, partial [Tanacetum coccineum]
MSPGLSANVTEVAAMSDSTFCKRFRSFYESSPSLSPPDLPLWKRYRGNGYLRKGQKSKPKQQNRARERKDREKSKRQNQSKKKSQSQPWEL